MNVPVGDYPGVISKVSLVSVSLARRAAKRRDVGGGAEMCFM
jgi:hypothetical protein